MGWKVDEIRKKRRAEIENGLSAADREQLLDRIADLETALYPFAITLGSLDDKLDWPRASMSVSSKLFPMVSEADEGKWLMFDSEAKASLPIAIPPPENLHEVEYYTEDSVNFGRDQGGKLHDSFEILAVHQSGTACYIGCGDISMEDVRRAVRTLEARSTASSPAVPAPSLA